MHGFYAVMGGYAFLIPEDLPESKKFLPTDTRETWFLTDRTVFPLEKHDAWRKDVPNMSQEEIKPESKAGGFAKTLVCLQAFWFITQCLTRRTC